MFRLTRLAETAYHFVPLPSSNNDTFIHEVRLQVDGPGVGSGAPCHDLADRPSLRTRPSRGCPRKQLRGIAVHSNTTLDVCEANGAFGLSCGSVRVQ